MLVLFYYNWGGTREERDQHEEAAREHLAKMDGVKLVGIYSPSIAWNRVRVIETDSFDKLYENALPCPHCTNSNIVILF